MNLLEQLLSVMPPPSFKYYLWPVTLFRSLIPFILQYWQMTDMDDAMAKAVDIGENDVSFCSPSLL